MVSLISDKTLKKVEEEKKDKTTFLTITYDIPSENLTTIKEDTKRKFLNKRLQILGYVSSVGLRLNNSTYVVHVDRIDELLRNFETVYSDYMDRVNLKIVGNAYSDVVKDILIKDIERIKEELTKDLEILETEIREVSNDYQKYQSGKKIDFEEMSNRNQKLKKRLYTHSKTLTTLSNRIVDLEKLDKVLSDRYLKAYEKLNEYRRTLLNRCI